MRQILVKLKWISGNFIFRSCQTRRFYGKWFPKMVYCQFKHSLRVRLVAVKCFPKNTYFPEMLISRKGKCFPLFGCLGNRFPENQFRCLVRPNILRKINSSVWFVQTFYEKYLTEIVLRKIISSVWFVDHFYRKYEMCYKFKHLYCLDNPVIVQN